MSGLLQWLSSSRAQIQVIIYTLEWQRPQRGSSHRNTQGLVGWLCNTGVMAPCEVTESQGFRVLVFQIRESHKVLGLAKE